MTIGRRFRHYWNTVTSVQTTEYPILPSLFRLVPLASQAKDFNYPGNGGTICVVANIGVDMCSVNQPEQGFTLTVTKHSTHSACVYSHDAGVLYAVSRVFLFRLPSFPLCGTTP